MYIAAILNLLTSRKESLWLGTEQLWAMWRRHSWLWKAGFSFTTVYDLHCTPARCHERSWQEHKGGFGNCSQINGGLIKGPIWINFAMNFLSGSEWGRGGFISDQKVSIGQNACKKGGWVREPGGRSNPKKFNACLWESLRYELENGLRAI